MRITINKNIFIYCLLLSLFLFLFSSRISPAEVIWQVGGVNGSDQEFIDSNNKIIKYEIPPDWETKIGTWEFYKKLYPFNNSEGKNPQEININYDYQKDYSISHLVIYAGVYQDVTQYIEVYKGPEAKKETLLKREKVNKTNFTPQIFHILNIKKGLLDENGIILRVFPYQENTTSSVSPIIFDALFLYRVDSDGDGILDLDEGSGDWDKDGITDQLDKDTACTPIEWNLERDSLLNIYLDIVEGEGESPSFHDVRFLDQNVLDIPYWLRYERFLPYGIMGFIIEGFEPDRQTTLQINYFAPVSSSAQYHFYQSADIWKDANFRFLDNRTVSITLEDGQTGDSDGEINGRITSIMAMTYPNSLNIDIEKGNCFITILMND